MAGKEAQDALQVEYVAMYAELQEIRKQLKELHRVSERLDRLARRLENLYDMVYEALHPEDVEDLGTIREEG